MKHNTRQRLDLAGQWEIAFAPPESAGQDADASGLSEGWMAGRWPTGLSETVAAPALWTVSHPDKTGIGFYRRQFNVPSAWHGRVVRLCIGGASFRLDAWLNGVFAGSHEGAYTPFRLDVSHGVRAGAGNELVLRVASLSKTEPVDGLLLQHCPAAKQSWYYIEAGLWGEVYLEALPLLWCEELAIEPDLNGRRVVVDVETHNASAAPHHAELRLVAAGPDGQSAAEATSRLTLLPGTTHHRYSLALPRPIVWSCENPALYGLRATLISADAVIDEMSAAFGMRDFTVGDGQFFLNGQPIYLRGVLLQPNYPASLICPPSADMMRQEITLAKEAGFNLIRTHLRPSPPGFLDICDEMGMMVYAESSLAWIKDNPRLLDHGRRELEAMIRRDRNHPSVVVWGIFNENRPATALAGDALTRFVRALDPTRVVVDNSGGSLAIDQDFGWVDRATVIANRQTERRKIMDTHLYIGAPTPPAACEWLRTLGAGAPAVDMPALGFGLPAVLEEFYCELRTYQGQIFVSELGCGGMSDLRDTVKRFAGRDGVDARELRSFCESLERGFAERRLERVFGSLDNLIAAAQEQQALGDVRQIEAVLANRRVSGYCLTQLNDVAWEFHAGIVDLWRRPKRVHEALKRVNRPHCVILKAERPVAACGREIRVAVTVVDGAPLPAPAAVSVTVSGAVGAPLRCANYGVPAGAGVKELATMVVDSGDQPGVLRVAARLHDSSGQVLADTTETVAILPQVEPSAACRRVWWLGEVPAGPLPTEPLADSQVLGVPKPASLSGQDWTDLLTAVASGKVAIIGPLQPGHQTAIAALAGHGHSLRVAMAIGSWMGCYHWIPTSPLFAGLPAGGLAGEAYTSVLPRYTLSEQGGDVLAGTLYNTNSRFEPPAMLWYSDVEAVAHGKGRLLFCQYRVFDQSPDDPLASRLLCNLIEAAHSYLG